MRKTIAFVVTAVLLALGSPAPAPAASQPETLFQWCERAWGVGTIHLSKPLGFREGKLQVFPSQFTDLVWAPEGSKPRNMMLVHEVWPDDKDKPFLENEQDIFAPVLLLPEHAYYKDNLPPTRRHQIAGGRRYVFRGDQIPEVRKIVEAYLKAYDMKGMDRWKEEIVAVAAALESTIQYVREDAVRWFELYPTLARDFDNRALPSIKAYLAGNAPPEEKAKLIDVFAAARIDSVKPLLQEQAQKQDASGAAALRAMTGEGGGNESTDALLEKSRSPSKDVQRFALEQLGARAGTDDAAFARCKEVLDVITSPPPLSHGCISGLGRANTKRTNDLLVFVVERGDTGSREAAAALATMGSSEGEAELTRILKEKSGEPAIAAAGGLARMTTCTACGKTLEEQYHDHPDHSVRDLIGVLIGVPLVHKH